MVEKIFADGIRFSEPSEKAPDFIKGRISIQAEQALAFIEKYKDERGWLNLDVKESKGGKLYVELNTWKKGETQSAPKGEAEEDEINPDDIPF